MADGGKLTDEADDFFRTLPGVDYPQALVDGYPRIANKIVELRYHKDMLRKYFDGLLTDERGGRQGFPFAVLVNVQSLYDAMVGISDGFVSDTGKWQALKKR